MQPKCVMKYSLVTRIINFSLNHSYVASPKLQRNIKIFQDVFTIKAEENAEYSVDRVKVNLKEAVLQVECPEIPSLSMSKSDARC